MKTSVEASPLLGAETTGDLKLFLEEMEKVFTGLKQGLLAMHAIDSGLFDFLKEERGIDSIAAAFKWDPVMAELFCTALVAAGFLEGRSEKNGRLLDSFINTLETTRFLTRTSSLGQSNNMANKIRKLKLWMDLHSILASGSPEFDEKTLCTNGWMNGIAESSLDGQIPKVISRIESHVDLSRCSKLLDLGGGHGLCAIAIAARFPSLQCTVLDKPGIVKVAREHIARYRSTVSVVAGDYTRDCLPGPQDIIFISFSPAGSDTGMLAKIAAAIAPRGFLIIRRHAEDLADDALLNLEWNFFRPRGRRAGATRFNLSEHPSIKEYISCMEQHGLSLACRERFDDISELLVAKKEGEKEK